MEHFLSVAASEERGGRDDEEMEEGEIRAESYDGSREVAMDGDDNLVVTRDVRQLGNEETGEVDEEAVDQWVRAENEAERGDEEHGGDEADNFIFEENQLLFEEFNDPTRLASELCML